MLCILFVVIETLKKSKKKAGQKIDQLTLNDNLERN